MSRHVCAASAALFASLPDAGRVVVRRIYLLEAIRDLENLNHPWGGVEGAPRGYPGPSTPPQGGGSGAGAARPRTPTLGCFEISESLSPDLVNVHQNVLAIVGHNQGERNLCTPQPIPPSPLGNHVGFAHSSPGCSFWRCCQWLRSTRRALLRPLVPLVG